MSAATAPVDAVRDAPSDVVVTWARRNAWALSLVGFLVLLLVFTKLIQPTYGVTGIQGLGISVLPLALAAVAQAVVVIAGGIDLSIGSLMALTGRGLGCPHEGSDRRIRCGGRRWASSCSVWSWGPSTAPWS